MLTPPEPGLWERGLRAFRRTSESRASTALRDSVAGSPAGRMLPDPPSASHCALSIAWFRHRPGPHPPFHAAAAPLPRAAGATRRLLCGAGPVRLRPPEVEPVAGSRHGAGRSATKVLEALD